MIDDVAARPLVAFLLVAADVVWVVVSAVFGFPTRLDSIFQTLVAALTLAMVFVIQHTQSRDELAIQRKLDEILHALPNADNAVISIEEASDEELRASHDTHRQRRGDAVDTSPASDG
ncbi:MAG: low affinity iron permease family protein [Pseudonocardiales bacterium]